MELKYIDKFIGHTVKLPADENLVRWLWLDCIDDNLLLRKKWSFSRYFLNFTKVANLCKSTKGKILLDLYTFDRDSELLQFRKDIHLFCIVMREPRAVLADPPQISTPYTSGVTKVKMNKVIWMYLMTVWDLIFSKYRKLLKF